MIKAKAALDTVQSSREDARGPDHSPNPTRFRRNQRRATHIVREWVKSSSFPDAAAEADAVLFRCRAIWISDIHLGTRDCNADHLLSFLRATEAEVIYLVGDIVDCWRLRRSWFWPQSHNDVIQKLLRKVRKGTRIVYIPGNHDEVFRAYAGLQFGGIEVEESCIHTTVDGRRFLITHGDQFDGVMSYARWLAILGDWAYQAALRLNTAFNIGRRRLGLPYWSVSAYLKYRVKNAVQFISNFEEALVYEAMRHGVNGIVCGHVHHPEIRDVHGILYCNDGDWVESCTALVEHVDGRIELVRWPVPDFLGEIGRAREKNEAFECAS